MNVVRSVISFFILVLIAVSVAGWIWAGGQPSPRAMMGSRVALAVSAVAGVVGLVAVWRPQHGDTGHGQN
jgi:hypothetical protein